MLCVYKSIEDIETGTQTSKSEDLIVFASV